MMKSNRSLKKRKKERTWAEAATMALQSSPNKKLGVRDILQTIYDKSLKSISLDKAAENVLATMLNHHVQLPNCPFFRVQSGVGVYALKSSWLRKQGEEIPNEIKEYEKEEEADSTDSSALIEVDRISPSDEKHKNHAYSIQGKALSSSSNSKHVFSSLRPFRKKNSLLRPSSVNSRRHSSPVKLPYHVSRTSLAQRRRPVVTRASSLTSRYASMHNNHYMTLKTTTQLDLESPSSILVHANMRTLVNKENFSILPASYRYKLTELLPECDQALIDAGVKDHKILAPSDSALTNEFFTQAVQEWRERLSDGEFTRETQSRIMQEIAKERCKIDPWKEKFFEEYYGQKKVTTKRLRSRSQNVAAQIGHKMRDLGMEAQLAIFAHLRPELDGDLTAASSSESDRMVSDEDDVPLQNLIPSNTQHSPSEVSKKAGLDETVVKSRLNNSIVPKLPTDEVAQSCKDGNREKEKPRVTSIIMRPTWSAISKLADEARIKSSCVDSADKEEAMLNVRKQNGEAVIDDHSYTSTPWKTGSLVSNCGSSKDAVTSSAVSKPTTLVLRPSGNLVQSNIASLQKAGHSTVKKNMVVKSNADSIKPNHSNSVFNNKLRSLASIKATMRMFSTCSTPSDTERVLSLHARPLTPESFAAGGNKTSGVISNVVKQFSSPLLTPDSHKHDLPPAKKIIKNESPVTQPKSKSITVASQQVVSQQKTAASASLNNGSTATLSSIRTPNKKSLITSIDSKTIELKNIALVKTSHSGKVSTLLHNQQDSTSFPLSRISSPVSQPHLSFVSGSHSTVSHPTQPHPSLYALNVSHSSNLSHAQTLPSKNRFQITSSISPKVHISPRKPSHVPQVTYSNHIAPISGYSTLPHSFAPFLNLPLSISHPVHSRPSTTSFTPIPLPSSPLSVSNNLTRPFPPNTPFFNHLPPPAIPRLPHASTSLISLKRPLEQPTTLQQQLPTAVKQRPPVCSQIVSSLPTTRPTVAGTKRAMSDSPSAVSPPVRWSSSPNDSPSPMKKTRTLAEIKAQIKAKRAAVVARPALQSPVVSQQPSSQSTDQRISSTSSHVFSATTFPVYFPNDPSIKANFNHVANDKNPTAASYIKLPPNSTLPLEKVQWVSHPDLKAAQPGNSNTPTSEASSKATTSLDSKKPIAVATSITSSPHKLKSATSGKKGKITLKIKAAGAAISLKVDADVINKEMKRSGKSPSTDGYMSSEDSNSDISDAERPKLFKHHSGPIKLPKVGPGSSETDSDPAPPNRLRWSGISDLDTGQDAKSVSSTSVAVSSSRSVPVTTPALPVKSQPVFGEPPFCVSITPGSNIMSSSNNTIKNSLFHSNQSSQLFRNPTTTTGAWSANQTSSNAINSSASSYQRKRNHAFRSTSKGKDMKNMQKLVRTPFHSDDSTDDNDEQCGTISSDDGKCSETDDDDVMSVSTHRETETIQLVAKRHTRSSAIADDNKLKSISEITPTNLPNLKTT